MRCLLSGLMFALMAGRAIADTAPPVGDGPPRVVDGESAVVGHALPALAPDGEHAAWLEHGYGYDDSSSDVLVIAPVPPAAAIKRANELLTGFVALPAWEVGDERRWHLGARQLAYSRKTGVLEITVGKRVILREKLREKRPWQCCGFAGPEDGSCKRPPETLDGAWGDERALIVQLGYKDGPDGCEVDHFTHVFRPKR